MSTIPERHVPDRGLHGARHSSVPCLACGQAWGETGCDAITEHRERVAAEQAAARLAESLREWVGSYPWERRTHDGDMLTDEDPWFCPWCGATVSVVHEPEPERIGEEYHISDDCPHVVGERALRLHDERVKGGTT